MENEKTGSAEIYLAPEEPAEKVISDEIEAVHTEEIKLEEPEKSPRVKELLERRTEKCKVFSMSDGTEQAVFFAEDIHILNEDTQSFDEADNIITEDEDGKHFVGGYHKFKARFSREEDNDELFSIESGIHRVTVSAKKTKRELNKGVKPYKHKKSDKGNSTEDFLTYENVHEGADYEYSVSGKGVKENIIVKEKADIYRFAFIIKQENVTAQLDEAEKTISFVSKETGEEVFFIPAPFMADANGEVSTSVTYDLKAKENGEAVLTVSADRDFMNDESRAFPVVIDPEIQLSGSSAMTVYSWNNGQMSSASKHNVGAIDNGNGTYNVKRVYFTLNMPSLPRNPRIKKAELVLFQDNDISTISDNSKIGLYSVDSNIYTGQCTPSNSSNLIDYAVIRKQQEDVIKPVSYSFDVTNLIDNTRELGSDTQKLVLKMTDEAKAGSSSNVTIYGTGYSQYAPQFVVTYESTYGVNTSYRTHTHEIGRFGQGSIDLQRGNLMFESEDFAWAGNRMPVTIKHLYNSALSNYQYTKNASINLHTADFSAMKVGLGYKLNIMQSMVAVTSLSKGNDEITYVYMGENGDETYFKESKKTCLCDSGSQCYYLHEDVDGGSMLYDSEKRTLTQGSETYLFDTAGRLIKITDGNGNHMDINYTYGKITSVTDGAGRDFEFDYSNGYLLAIIAPDGTDILYEYTNTGLLKTITYPGSRSTNISYPSNKNTPSEVMLKDENDVDVYKVAYTFNNDRVTSVTEYGVENGTFVMGNKSAYSYSVYASSTTVTTTEQADDGESSNRNITTVYAFDDDGNIINQYAYADDINASSVEGEQSGIHPYAGEGGMNVASNINNLLEQHNFETRTKWLSMPANCDGIRIEPFPTEQYSVFGKKVLLVESLNTNCTANGVYQTSIELPKGEYTFSSYIRTRTSFTGGMTPGAYIRVTDTSGNILAESEHLVAADSEFVRLTAPFTLTSAKKVQTQILLNGKGTLYADGAQLENNDCANAYNTRTSLLYGCGFFNADKYHHRYNI